MTTSNENLEAGGSLLPTPGVTMTPRGSQPHEPARAESGGARRRVLNLLSRHPDLVAGRLERVAAILCEESALALSCSRVGLWELTTSAAADRLSEIVFNGKRFEEQADRWATRDQTPAFFAALERRRLLEGDGLHEMSEALHGGMAATIHVDGAVWGVVSFERSQGAALDEAEMDFALLVAEMIGRCVERGHRASLEGQLERAEDALSAFSRMMGDSLSFEVVDGRLVCQGDPRLLLGPPPAGQDYDAELLMGHIRKDERDVLERRFRDWAGAGAPGVLSARFHYKAGPTGSDKAELDLDCRLMRSRSPQGMRLWGVLRLA